jgi:ATPase subunit of ABC transporter with duplicated ATPase domains
MDFNTYLKKELGFQPGQVIPPNRVAGFKEKYNRYLKSQEEEFRKAAERQQQEQANAARIQGASALFESKVNEAQKSGRQTDPNLITAARNLIGAGQVDQATKIEEALFGQAISTSEQVDRMELEEKKENKIIRSEEAINTYYDAVDELAKVKEARVSDLSSVVGPTEFLARPGRAIAAEFGSEGAKKNQQLIKNLTMLTTNDVLKNVRALAPVTKEDRVFIATKTVPVESDPDNIWDSFLSQKEATLERAIKNLDKKYNISGAATTNEPDIEQNKPQTATQKLRGRLQ